MTPIRFGPPEKSLYGVFHLAENRRQPNEAVLLCNPFGQEAVRIHRLYRVLAERLARAGIHTLRFDYFATGESGGEDADGTMKTWMEDIHLANQELKNRSRATQITWVGARLGASLSALASATAPLPPSRLLLWDPVTDGSAYLDELTRAHVQAVAASIWGTARPKAELSNEVIGFGIGTELLRELKAVDASDFSKSVTEEALVVSPPLMQRKKEILQALSKRCKSVRQVELEVAFDWNSEEALNTALVPASALQLLSNLLEKGAV